MVGVAGCAGSDEVQTELTVNVASCGSPVECVAMRTLAGFSFFIAVSPFISQLSVP